MSGLTEPTCALESQAQYSKAAGSTRKIRDIATPLCLSRQVCQKDRGLTSSSRQFVHSHVANSSAVLKASCPMEGSKTEIPFCSGGKTTSRRHTTAFRLRDVDQPIAKRRTFAIAVQDLCLSVCARFSTHCVLVVEECTQEPANTRILVYSKQSAVQPQLEEQRR